MTPDEKTSFENPAHSGDGVATTQSPELVTANRAPTATEEAAIIADNTRSHSGSSSADSAPQQLQQKILPLDLMGSLVYYVHEPSPHVVLRSLDGCVPAWQTPRGNSVVEQSQNTGETTRAKGTGNPTGIQ